MTDFSKYDLNRKERLFFYITVASVSIAASMLFYHNLLPAIAVIPFLNKIKRILCDKLLEKRICELTVSFKDFLFLLSTAIASGRSMKDAIGESVSAIRDIHGERDILAYQFEKIYDRLQIGNENDIDVLMEFAFAAKIDDITDFVTIYSICKSTGASLILALNRASAVIIEKMTIEEEIRGMVKRKKTEGIMLFIMPVIIMFFLNVCAPDYIAPMYESIAGRIIMSVVIIAIFGIYQMISRITRVEI